MPASNTGNWLSYLCRIMVKTRIEQVKADIATHQELARAKAGPAAGLTAAGLTAAQFPAAGLPGAASAVLLFRLLTFWLPVPLGWGTLKYLEREQAL